MNRSRQHKRHEYVLVLPIEPFQERFRKSDYGGRWPRHITVLPAFSHVGSRRTMQQRFEDLARCTDPIKVRLGEAAVFGGAEVRLLETGADKVSSLHFDALEMLPSIGCLVRDKFVEEAFEPHVKNVGADEFIEELALDSMLLISKCAKDIRTVEAEFGFVS